MNKNINFRAAFFVMVWIVAAILLVVVVLSSKAQERVSECVCKNPAPQATCVEIHTNVYFEELSGLLNSRIDDVGKFDYKLENQGGNLYTVFIVRDSPCAENNKQGVIDHANK